MPDDILMASVMAFSDMAPVAQHSTRNDSTLDTYPTTVQAVRSFVQTDSSFDVTADAEYAHADVMT